MRAVEGDSRDTAKLRNYKMKRADSAASITAEPERGAPSGQPKHAPPLAADSAKAKATQTKLQSALDALGRLETRLDQFEQRKAQGAECARRAEAALALAEEIAEVSTGYDARRARPPGPKQRLN